MRYHAPFGHCTTLLIAPLAVLLAVAPAASYPGASAASCYLKGVDPSRVESTQDTILFVVSRALRSDGHYGTRPGPLRYGLSVVTFREEVRGSFYEGMNEQLCMRRRDVPLSVGEFVGYVTHRLRDRGPWGHSAALYVHGFLNGHDDALYRSAEIKHRLRYDGTLIVFSWPASESGVPTPGKYTHDRRMALAMADSLRTVLQVLAGIEPGKTSILAHSLGAEMLTRALARPLPGDSFRSVSYLAPDVERAEFRARSVPAAQREARRVTLYAIRGDRALQASRLRSLLARSGVRPRAGEVIRGRAVTAPGLETVDITYLQSIWNSSMWGLRHSLQTEGRALYDLLWNTVRDMPASCRAERGLAWFDDGIWRITQGEEAVQFYLSEACRLRPDPLRDRPKMTYVIAAPFPQAVQRVEQALASLRFGSPQARIESDAGIVELGPLGEHGAIIRAELRRDGARTRLELRGEETDPDGQTDFGDIPLTRVDFILRRVANALSAIR
jgi:pimeloyl-ACP methyl ester carboxylesterase